MKCRCDIMAVVSVISKTLLTETIETVRQEGCCVGIIYHYCEPKDMVIA
jgi:hypothetical protein